MKEFILGMSIIVAVYFALNYVNTPKQLSLSAAISQCTKNQIADKCSVESVMNNIKSISSSNQLALWNTSNQLINMNNGDNIFLNTSELNYDQLIVWNSYLAESKSQQRNNYMNDNNIFGNAVAVIFFLAAFGIFIALVPFVWRFLLRRISEVSKAVKGDKID